MHKALKSTGKGVSHVLLPKLKKGKYTVVVSYSGTRRISPSTITLGTVTY